MLMNTLWFLFIGVMAGALAAWLTGHRLHPLGDLTVGVIGSFIGSFLFGLLGVPAGGDVGSFLSAVAGAATLLGLLRVLRFGGAS